MSGQELMLERQELAAKLDVALRSLSKRGKEYAEREQIYKVELAKKIAEEREKGTPVTIISDVCRGNSKIAQLRFQRDVAEVVYKSAQEAINVYKLQARLLDNQIDREFRG